MHARRRRDMGYSSAVEGQFQNPRMVKTGVVYLSWGSQPPRHAGAAETWGMDYYCGGILLLWPPWTWTAVLVAAMGAGIGLPRLLQHDG